MTLSDLTSKTPEELNVMCAEALGLKCGRCNGTGRYKRIGDHEAFRMACDNNGRKPEQFADCDHFTKDFPSEGGLFPNYTGSWDAIMPEVRKLNRDKQHAMMRHLFELLDIVEEAKHGAVEITCACLLCDATAQQLTIALILTLNP